MSEVLERLRARRERARRVLLATDRPPKLPQTAALEARGYDAWLAALGSRTFTSPLADFHRELWDWYWAVTLKRLRGEKLSLDDLVFLAIWGRGLGKSSNVEWACIAEGALLGEGFVGYVCETENQAREHVAAIKGRLESSEIARYYPGLAEPEIGGHGYQRGWRQDYLATASGWGIVPLGLDKGVRGGRKDDLRFTMFVLDDIDDVNDSPLSIEKKLLAISRSILPAGTDDTLVLFPQNLIHEDGVLNQIYTRRSDVLAHRRVSGPVPAFSELEIGTAADGLPSIDVAAPVWDALDVDSARKYLSKFGPRAFLAEYQHDFEGDRAELVLKHWRDEIHVITQSEFAKVFGSRTIPDRWNKYVFHDFARTNTADHANVAGFVAVSSMGEPLPGYTFLYDCMTFDAGTEPDDVALRLLKAIAPRRDWESLIRAHASRDGLERYLTSATDLLAARRDVLSNVIPDAARRAFGSRNFMRWVMSHEAESARRVYNNVFGLPFQASNPGADGGVDLINHLMRVDRAREHPFRSGVTGHARFFMVVPDSEAATPAAVRPESLRDSQRARYQFKRWRNRPPKTTEAGEVERGLLKKNDDFGNGLMMLYYRNPPSAAPMTERERRDAMRPAGLRDADVARQPDPRIQSAMILSQHFWDSEREVEERSRSSRFPVRVRFRRG